jgi:hypothetical protein
MKGISFSGWPRPGSQRAVQGSGGRGYDDEPVACHPYAVICPSLSITESKAAHIITSGGATDQAAWGTRAKWVTYHGPDPQGHAVSVTIFDHPQNLRHPTWWHSRDYGLFAANPFGIHDFEKGGDKAKGNHLLAHGQTLVLRYRVLIESGGPDQAKLAEMHAAFGKDAN